MKNNCNKKRLHVTPKPFLQEKKKKKKGGGAGQKPSQKSLNIVPYKLSFSTCYKYQLLRLEARIFRVYVLLGTHCCVYITLRTLDNTRLKMWLCSKTISGTLPVQLNILIRNQRETTTFSNKPSYCR